MPYICSKCGKQFTRKYYKDKHYQKKHIHNSLFLKKKFDCPFCAQKDFQEKKLLVLHVDEKHLNSLKYKLIKSAFNGKISLFRKKLVTLQTLEKFISDKKNFEEIFQVIKHQLSKFNIVEVALILTADYRVPSIENDFSVTENNSENNDNSDSLLAEERDSFTLRTKREIFNVNKTEKSTKKSETSFKITF